jgi:hypothetical protein
LPHVGACDRRRRHEPGGGRLTTEDIGHLEKLDDPAILAALPGGHRWLRRNDRADVISYLETWADLLELDCPAVAA